MNSDPKQAWPYGHIERERETERETERDRDRDRERGREAGREGGRRERERAAPTRWWDLRSHMLHIWAEKFL